MTFLGIHFALRCVLSPSSVFFHPVSVSDMSPKWCLVSCLFRRFLAELFFSGVGITILRTFVSSAVVFAWELMDGPASFETAVDCATGGPVGLWFSDGIS